MLIIGKKAKKPNVDLIDNNIIINRMNHPSCVTSFIRNVNLAIKRGKKDIDVVCKCEKGRIFPDACVPISALINNYSRIYNVNFNIIIDEDSYLNKCNFVNPIDMGKEDLKKCKNPLDKIFLYSSKEGNESQVADIVQLYIDCMSKTTECEEGILSSLIWCINEVMDNVLVHSQEQYGYIMAQYHRNKKVLAICVYDFGIGIYNSLMEGSHKPNSELDAITMAVQEGVGDGKGQGNGLYGLFQIVSENGGRLNIASGKSAIMLKGGELKKFEHNVIASPEHPGTIVDFQLDLSKKIDIQSALRTLNGYDGFDIRIDNMWDDNDRIHYDVYANCSGTGTRAAGRELRYDVINTIKRANAPIILDFINVKTCSSSFIDEFLSKLIIEMSILEFNKLVSIINMNSFVSHLFERSTAMRIHQEWENNK